MADLEALMRSAQAALTTASETIPSAEERRAEELRRPRRCGAPSPERAQVMWRRRPSGLYRAASTILDFPKNIATASKIALCTAEIYRGEGMPPCALLCVRVCVCVCVWRPLRSCHRDTGRSGCSARHAENSTDESNLPAVLLLLTSSRLCLEFRPTSGKTRFRSPHRS